MELLQAELLGWTCCVTDLLILQRDFSGWFYGCGWGWKALVCSVWFLEWLGHLLPMDEGPSSLTSR